ncbi:hypothetical protein [Aquimarina sp. 2201CG14-23]|uniref:hypothetical protein n=1 Tax=Aquimarina mycalae TaxID=3040073 RepID=UPI002478202B|nr:hypothetical protein [Aquimarina sp. 2201CG14-23]MDH7445511.1 hypothetical protein [Aquimarina sp. 2201CG14-23]
MNIKLLIAKDADFRLNGGYECEWAYCNKKKQLLLGIQKYSSIEYIYILFDEVAGYKFSNWMFDEFRQDFNEEEDEGLLYEIISNKKNEDYKHYLTLEPSQGSLQVFASSYKILSRSISH